MGDTIIRNAQVINEGKIISADILIRGQRIERVDSSFDVKFKTEEINREAINMSKLFCSN